ncbi:hypothetical protein O181_068316 [Austropuccinia psidii MF-1]|uniref:Wax synthase domain-containing protein n=1 Tax=Austropuccinia psidii MF-1 TaxID=1389203 RepID=A0A9Q3EUL2_9BASI|nr:hypothetical protein [Austropuccinia psidii MF-1]
MIDAVHSNFNIQPALFPISLSFILLFLSAFSLPSKSKSAIYFRLILLPFQLIIAYDIAINPTYSLGSAFRNSAFPSLAYFIIYRALDFALINLWDNQLAFHWIIPQTSISNNSNLQSIKWKKAPLPESFSFDRIIWSLDNLFAMRPGTPWLFPWKLRALDWSKSKLESNHSIFGQPEWPIHWAIPQQILHLLCHLYIRKLNLNHNQNLFLQPYLTQVSLTFALGGIVAFSNALEEAIIFPILIKFNILPKTALISFSNRPILSTSLSEFWGKRWHQLWRRSFIRIARLVPGSNHPAIHLMATFWVSALMHCLLISRLYPTPNPLQNPKSLLPLFYEPGIYFFFLSQGLGILIEQACSFLFSKILFHSSKYNQLKAVNHSKNSKNLNHQLQNPQIILKRLAKIFNLLWLLVVLIGTGRHVTNTLVLKGLMLKVEWDKVSWKTLIKSLFNLPSTF